MVQAGQIYVMYPDEFMVTTVVEILRVEEHNITFSRLYDFELVARTYNAPTDQFDKWLNTRNYVFAGMVRKG